MALVTLDSMSGLAMKLDRDVKEAAPAGVISCSVHVNHILDRIELGVTHALVTRKEMDEGNWRRLVPVRVRKALLLEDEGIVAKRDRMQRRQLIARGRDARAAKPKKAL